MVDAKPTVVYFGLHARGSGIRLLLKHAGVDFNDAAPGSGDWAGWPELK